MIAARASAGLRLGAFYGATFAMVGVYLPFFPLWLEQARGLGPEAIGWVIAPGYWPRVVTTLLITREADRRGTRRRPILLLVAMTLAGVTAYVLASEVWALVVLSALTGVTFAAVLPLGETLALQECRRHGLDYGRVRLWGSIAFILTAIGGGRLIEAGGAGIVLPLLIVLVGTLFLICLALPEEETPAKTHRLRLRDLAGQPGLVRFLAAGALLQASHSVYYGFATIHWRGAGLGDAVVGALWAEGVIAEIMLFALAGRLLAGVAPARLLLLAAALAALRWSGTAIGSDLLLLVPLQALHAASFGACHLAVMHRIRDGVPEPLQGSAQGLYAALTALLFGLITPLSGALYGTLAGGAFLAMAAVAILAGALVRGLANRPRAHRSGP